jgi:hypothetical protein
MLELAVAALGLDPHPAIGPEPPQYVANLHAPSLSPPDGTVNRQPRSSRIAAPHGQVRRPA